MEATAKFIRLEDPRSTTELLAAAKHELLSGVPDDDIWQVTHILRARGTPEVFHAAEQWCRSADPAEREVATLILGQLGRPTDAYHAESVALLIPLLSDADLSVVAAAAQALGHRNDPSAIPHLLPLIGHPKDDVRFGVMAGLSCQDDPRAIAALIELSRDADRAIRDWATFGLGSQTEVDTPELREALLARIVDEDPATRGEALIGLANRHDLRVIEPLVRELQGEYHGSWVIEAAETLALPVFHKFLLPLRPFIEEHCSWHFTIYEAALTACQPPEDVRQESPSAKREEGT